MKRDAFMLIIGAAIGSVVTWYIARDYYEKINAEDAEEVRAWARQQIDEKHKASVDIPDQPTDVSDSREDPRPWIPTKEEIGTYNDYAKAYQGGESTKPSLEEIRAGLEHPTEDDEATEEPDEEEELEEGYIDANPDFDDLDPERPPYIIPEHEFSSDSIPEWGKEQLIYYEDDDTLTDEDDHPLEVDIVGGENLTQFDREKNILFVRNNRLHCDYEVELVHDSYASYVLGIEEDDRGFDRKRSNREEEK